MRIPGLSIVVPFGGQAEPFEATLVSVLQNRPRDAEVLVVHASCYDDPYDLKDEIRFVEAPAGSGLTQLVNLGVATARAEIVHWLQCGLQVDDGWTGPAVKHFDDRRVGAVSPLVVDVDDPRRVVAAGVAYRAGGLRWLPGAGEFWTPVDSRWSEVLGPTILGGYYRKAVLELLGGFDASLAGSLADVDMALSLSEIGRRSVFEPASRIYGRGDDARLAGGFATLRCVERVFWRHARGQGWLRSLASHPWTVGAELLAGLPRRSTWSGLLGRGAACLELAGRRQRYRHLLSASRAARCAGRGSARGRWPAVIRRAA